MNKIGLFLLVIWVLGTSCAPQSRTLNDVERNTVLAYSEAKTANLMQGMHQNDYAVFARDLDDKMKSAIDQTGFADLRIKINGKIGNYVARRVERVEQQGGNIIVVYLAQFEKDNSVTMRVVFEAAEPHRITGLWFDSAQLRK